MKIIWKEQDLPKANLSVLAREAYLRVKSNQFGWFCDDTYIMPFFIDEQLHFFRRLVITQSPARIDGKEADETTYREFINNSIDYLSAHSSIADFIEKPQSNVVLLTPPNLLNSVKVIPWGTYVVDLTIDEEKLLGTFHTKHRNVIRKAVKDGVVVSKATMQEVHDLIADTLARQNVHSPSISYYEKLQNNIPSNVAFYKAELNGIVEGVAVIIYDKDCGYYMYGGSSEHHHVGSVNYLQYEIMLDLKHQGVKTYDLVGARIVLEEGSKYEGIQRFKSRFASSLVEGYSFKCVINKFKYWLFVNLVKLYGKLRGFHYIDSVNDTIKLMKEKGIELKI